MEDNISKIKERLNIVDVISDYLKLQKAGVNYKARCPFHSEKTSSFFVSPERQIWHCFGCGAGGDMFGFVKEIEGVEFSQALRTLAAKAGIELRFDPRHQEQKDLKTNLYAICQLADKFFKKQLWYSDIGSKALNYLRQRGVSDESIKKFQLGYAPDTREGLTRFLLSSGHDRASIINSGLAIDTETNGMLDRFRGRIVFPIVDLSGRTVGFSGRIFEPGLINQPKEPPAKYINTPQTPIYDKSHILYGLNLAKQAVRSQNRCLVVEGNLDVIMSHQAGVECAVAASGTALTIGHLNLIKRFTDNLDLCFDADGAGEIATDRGVNLALSQNMNVGILALSSPDIKDAADYVQRYGHGWLEYSAKQRKDFMQFYLEEIAHKYDPKTVLGKKTIAAKLLPLIKSRSSAVERSHWLNEVSLLLKVDQAALTEELKTFQSAIAIDLTDTTRQPAANPISIAANQAAQLDPLEETAISIAVKIPALLKTKEIDYNVFSDAGQKIIAAVNDSEADLNKTIKSVGDSLALGVEFSYLKSQELWSGFTDEELSHELDQILTQLHRRQITGRLANLEYEIKIAEKENNSSAVARLLAEFNQVTGELSRV